MTITVSPTTRAISPVLKTPILLLLLAILSLGGCSDTSNGKAKAEAGPKKRAVPVTIGISDKQMVPVEIQAIGTAEPNASVAVKAQVTGTLQRIHFKEGDDVKKGDPLFSLDPRPFTAMLNQAQGTLIRDRAQLDLARQELERYGKAVKKGYVSTEQTEQAATKVATLAATIKADEAAVENARLQLEYCTIFAPIDGRTGELQVTEGNLIKANADTAMLTINQVAPIKIAFSVPGRHFSDIVKYRNEGSLQIFLASPGGPLPATFAFLDNTIDQTTGTLRLKAEFANSERTFWPGQMTDVRLRLTSRPGLTVVPATAVQLSQKGPHIFVVKDDGTVEDRQVATGISLDGMTVIESGLIPGEKVVTEGQLQLVNGSRVEEQGKGKKAGEGTDSQAKGKATP
ncbi:MAG: efflux RND transporter periplasmic adaptor subunit [Desulforhopalus sp.]|nr:efflux RND transporter periplasmic adaptor subunit [Desulforhopalus sp.]